MRAEGDAVLGDLPQWCERHHLKAAGIRQDWMRPTHESMEAAKRGDAFGRRPQHQMIGVAEQNLRARGAHVVMVHALDRSLRADWHEGRRMHHAMRGGDRARTCGAIRSGQAEGKWLRHARYIFGGA